MTTFSTKILLSKLRKIAFPKIDRIEGVEPTLVTGKWRWWGTGDLKTWFTADFSRNKRDKIFFLILQKQKRIVIGFTVENTEKIKNILRDQSMLK